MFCFSVVFATLKRQIKNLRDVAPQRNKSLVFYDSFHGLVSCHGAWKAASACCVTFAQEAPAFDPTEGQRSGTIDTGLALVAEQGAGLMEEDLDAQIKALLCLCCITELTVDKALLAYLPSIYRIEK